MKDSGMGKAIHYSKDPRADRNLGEAEIRYKTLFEQSPDGILLIDTQGNFIEFNDAACRQLNYSREEFARLGISDINPFEESEDIQKSTRKALNEGRAEYSARHRTKDGEIRDVHVIAQVLNRAGQTFFHTIWRDITDHKRADKALIVGGARKGPNMAALSQGQ